MNHGATGQGSNSAVAVAELFEGLGRELNDFAVVYLDGAIGGRLVLDGSYRRGVTGNAGDIGLMPVAPSRLKQTPPPGRPSDILLNRASVTGLVRHLRANGVTVASSRDFEAALETQSALVGEWLEDCAEALTNPLLSIAVLLALRAIVIDGNLARPLIERLVAPLRAFADNARARGARADGTEGGHDRAQRRCHRRRDLAAVLQLRSRSGRVVRIIIL